MAALGSLSTLPRGACAQRKPAVNIRYNEVVRSILYTPAYVAITKGYFAEFGLEIEMATGQGGDRSLAALLGGSRGHRPDGAGTADLCSHQRVANEDSHLLRSHLDRRFHAGRRDKVDTFEWSMLKGKEILGRSAGTTPLLFLEAALRKNGLDPYKDVKLVNNVAVPARVAAWLAGQTQYGIFIEPEASQLELDGKAHFLASIGQTVGFAD